MKFEEVVKKAEKPSIELVERYKVKFETNKRYSNEDKIQKLIVEKIFDKDKYETILLTVVLINELYSTNIYRTDLITEHIYINRNTIHTLIKNGESKAIELVAKGHGIKELNFYSFASKYCNYFNPEEFPIYDSYIENMLCAYKVQDTSFEKFKRSSLKDYETFRNIIRKFRSHYELENFQLRDIDKFLWLYGKELFSLI
jgi:hypothetical protein